MHRLVILLTLIACAPKRVEAVPESNFVLETNLVAPDAGPFDFDAVPRREPAAPRVGGEMILPQTMPGQPAPR
ncbi:MAG: hypothetical protein JNK82_29395 [Myxococcaceae bacterium]|nr:hypothetical protein [Myxococcaceae bacterium]